LLFSRGLHPAAANVFATVKVVNFHYFSAFCVKVRNLLDFNMFLLYNCVKDKKNIKLYGGKQEKWRILA
jgi:hypothetical protein